MVDDVHPFTIFLIFFEHPKSLSKEKRGQAFLEAILLSGKDTEIEKLY